MQRHATPHLAGGWPLLERPGPAPAQTAALLLCVTLHALVTALPVALRPDLVDAFPGPAVLGVLPWLVAGPALVAGVLAPVAGRLIDSAGRVPLLVGALLLHAVAGTTPLWLATLPAVVASRLVVGIADAAVLTCVATLIGDGYPGRRRDQLFGLQTVIVAAGSVVFLALTIALSGAGWNRPFALHGLALPLVVLVVVTVRERRGMTSTGARRLPPLQWRRLQLSCGTTLAGGVLFAAPFIHLPDRLDEVGAAGLGAVAGPGLAAAAATAVGALSFGWLGRHGSGRLLPVALAVTGAGVVVLGVGPSIVVVALGGIVASAGGGLLLPTLLTWTVGSLNLEQRGRSTGWWCGSFSLGPALLTALVLALVPQVGLGGVLALIGLGGLVLATASPRLVRAGRAASEATAR